MEIRIIEGGTYTDDRGTITFVNEFDMTPIKRFYVIEHSHLSTIRGWRAHKIEQRWFNVIDGIFSIRLVKIDNWASPNKYAEVIEYVLSSGKEEILHVPAGYASCIQAKERNSKIMIFADFGIENSKMDDYLYPKDYFVEK